jgi:hypothetical protein
MSIAFNHRTGTISTGSTEYDATSVQTNTSYIIRTAGGDTAIDCNSSSSVDLYYDNVMTARAGGFGAVHLVLEIILLATVVLEYLTLQIQATTSKLVLSKDLTAAT